MEILNCHESSFRFPCHLHENYCVWLNLSCGEKIIQKGETRLLEPGFLGVIHPGDIHSNEPCESGSRSLKTFYLSPAKLKSTCRENLDCKETSVELRTNFYKSSNTIRLLLSLESSLLTDCSGSLERQTAFLAVVASLVRFCGGLTPGPAQARYEEKRRLTKAIDFFYDRMGDNFSLDEIASCLDCSPYYFIRFFKKATGLTPHAYLIQLRLEKARALLSQGRAIADAALQSGFNDQSHLYKYFQKRYGVSPKAYQKQTRMVSGHRSRAGDS
nr:AraC family transcriptional regulator [Desulfobotulus pelophilus]